jgi:hypothetical protein
MTGPSQWLIHLNIARLAIAAGQDDIGGTHFAAARQPCHPVIEKRVMMDERLAALLKSSSP